MIVKCWFCVGFVFCFVLCWFCGCVGAGVSVPMFMCGGSGGGGGGATSSSSGAGNNQVEQLIPCKIDVTVGNQRFQDALLWNVNGTHTTGHKGKREGGGGGACCNFYVVMLCGLCFCCFCW